MDISLKWLGAWVAALALAQAGRAVTASGTSPTAPDRGILASAGPLRDDDVSGWVLEQNSDQKRASEQVSPIAPSPARLSRSNPVSTPSVANRNSNPLNMKLGSGTRRYLAVRLATVSDIIPTDGGRFLKFESPETGFRAAADLLSTSTYGGLELDRALRRWSHNGYGAEILAGTRLDSQQAVPYLGQDGLRVLLHAMATAEGYRSATIVDEITTALRP